METKSGKIIVVTGGPRSGKSTLVRLLANHFDGKAFLEGEERDFPKRIIDDIVDGNKPLELMLWFRNLAVKQYIEAVEIKQRGGIAILDCFWLTNQPYIDSWVADEFERGLLTEVSDIDLGTFPWPDKVIVLKQSKEGIREFSKLGGREFEDSDDYLEKQFGVHKQHDTFFENIKEKHPNIVFINREGLDFINNKNDLDQILSVLE